MIFLQVSLLTLVFAAALAVIILEKASSGRGEHAGPALRKIYVILVLAALTASFILNAYPIYSTFLAISSCATIALIIADRHFGIHLHKYLTIGSVLFSALLIFLAIPFVAIPFLSSDPLRLLNGKENLIEFATFQASSLRIRDSMETFQHNFESEVGSIHRSLETLLGEIEKKSRQVEVLTKKVERYERLASINADQAEALLAELERKKSLTIFLSLSVGILANILFHMFLTFLKTLNGRHAVSSTPEHWASQREPAGQLTETD